MIHILFLILSLITTSNALFSEASSSITCTGTACNLLPESSRAQLNELPAQFQSQYLTKVLENMNEASSASNTVSGLMGMGTVNTIQFGAGVLASGSQRDPIDFQYRDFTYKQLPNIGFGVSPSLMLGFNLGWLFGQGPRDADELENRSILHRINIYLNGFSYKTNTAESKNGIPDSFNYTGDLSLTQMGVGVRLDLIQPGDGIFLRFLGVNTGAAVRRQNFAFDLRDTNTSNNKFTFGQFTGAWNAQSNFEYTSKAYSVPVDFRTGFQILRMISIFGGLGLSRSVGESSLKLERGGPIRFTTDSALATAFTSTGASTAQSDPSGFLDLKLSNSVKKNFSQSYAILGLEIDIWKLKLLTEAYLMENVQSVSAGVKLDF